MMSATLMKLEENKHSSFIETTNLGKNNRENTMCSMDLMFDMELDLDLGNEEDKNQEEEEIPSNKSPKSFPKENFNHLLDQTASDKYYKIPYQATGVFDTMQMSVSPPGGRFLHKLNRRLNKQ